MFEIKSLANSEVEIIGEISAEIFMSGQNKALKELSESIEVKGFRKGKIPEHVLIRHVSNHSLLGKMAIIALEKEYPKIIIEHKIKAIGRPEIVITKMAENNPLGFKIKTCVLPEITLPDYKSVAKKTIESKKNKNTTAENKTNEEKVKEKESVRMEILEKIAEEIKEEMPKTLIDLEKQAIMEEMKANIAQAGLKWEDYLKHVNKKEEKLFNDFEADAIKRVKFNLILEKIAEKEKIEVPAEELEKEADAVVEYYKKNGQNTEKERVKKYLYGAIKNQKLFQFLENQ